MERSRYLILTVFLLISFFVKGQVPSIQEQQHYYYVHTNYDVDYKTGSYDLINGLETSTNPDKLFHDVEGYPFLVFGWGKGEITFDNSRVPCEKLNLCFYNQNIIVNNNGQIVNLIPLDSIKTITINGKIVVYRDLSKDGSNLKKIPIEQLNNDGKAVLYKNYTCRFKSAEKAVSGYGGAKEAQFVVNNELLCSINGGKLISVPQKKEDFIKLFPDEVEKIKDFIQKNKINPKKEKDIIAIFNYYNSL